MSTVKKRAEDTLARQRILVISSDSQLRERLYDALSGHGFSVSTAVSFQNGLEILQQGKPVHLILLDVAVSKGQNARLVERVRHFDEKLPLVLLTRPGHDRVDTSTLRHIQACLPSDADTPTLLAVITRWLPLHRSVRKIHYPGPILIVDDERELLKNLEAFLKPRGCTVVKAASGEEALAQLAQCRPALVLLDIKMPGMDGLVTLKKIKALRPNLPVILATAVEDQELMAQASKLGAYDYILKPYNLAALEALLSSLKERANKAVTSATAVEGARR